MSHPGSLSRREWQLMQNCKGSSPVAETQRRRAAAAQPPRRVDHPEGPAKMQLHAKDPDDGDVRQLVDAIERSRTVSLS